MTKSLKNNSDLIKRAIVLDGLRALSLAQQRLDRLLKEDSYACGYREGFEDALLSVAQMIGVANEFNSTQKQPHTIASANFSNEPNSKNNS